MDIKVLEPQCCTTGQLAITVAEVLDELQLEDDFEVVTDMKEILGYGVMKTPGLVINGKVKAFGRIPTKEEIKKWIKEEK